jgi:hypothetical protein
MGMEAPFKLTLHGYIPPSNNEVLGKHWIRRIHEKQRAAHALRSCLQSMLSEFPTMTTPTAKSLKTCLCDLESYMATIGAFSKAGSSRQRLTRKTRKKPKSA